MSFFILIVMNVFITKCIGNNFKGAYERIDKCSASLHSHQQMWHFQASSTFVSSLPFFSFSFCFGFSWFFFFLVFSGPHPGHMKVPGLGVTLKLQLPAYSTATAMWDPSCICHLHHSSRQRRVLNPLSGVRSRTRVLMDATRVCYCYATTGTLNSPFFHC